MDDASSKACGACKNLEAYWAEKRRKEQEGLREGLLHPENRSSGEGPAEVPSEDGGSAPGDDRTRAT